MGPRLTSMFAVAAGASIGNLYLAQPLLGFIAGDLHTTTATTGWLVTATQIGYATGVLLLVPLGDVLDRRRFVPVMLLTSAAPGGRWSWPARASPWPAVTTAGTALCCFALTVWAPGRRGGFTPSGEAPAGRPRERLPDRRCPHPCSDPEPEER
jgi:MFS family permease